jgi:hypothetical protein
LTKFNQTYKKFRRIISLIEEVNLKEKLCLKRTLNLYKNLLKQCRMTDDQTIITTCQSLID